MSSGEESVGPELEQLSAEDRQRIMETERRLAGDVGQGAGQGAGISTDPPPARRPNRRRRRLPEIPKDKRREQYCCMWCSAD